MSHGFDNRGSQFDAAGNLRDWWTPADHAEYDRRTAKLVRQFDGFEPLPGHFVNGKLVLPENIADLAGLSIAWRAYLRTLHGRTPPVIGGLSGAQRFFIGYAQSYLGKRRDDALLALIQNNPHPPERYRVNGIVVHLPFFYQAFGVGSGDRMYLPPDRRASIW
jgi:putative endopeptidase